MSAEIAIITSFMAGAFLLLKIATYRGNDTETEEGPDFLRLLYLMVAFMFMIGGLFAGQQIAAQNGYQGIANVLNWIVTAALVIYALIGALVLWDFVQTVMSQFNSGGLSDDDWGW